MELTHLAALLGSVPVLTTITRVVKQLVPDRFRALVPLLLGVALSVALSKWTGQDMTDTVLQGLGLGGVASSARDLVRDNRAPTVG